MIGNRCECVIQSAKASWQAMERQGARNGSGPRRGSQGHRRHSCCKSDGLKDFNPWMRVSLALGPQAKSLCAGVRRWPLGFRCRQRNQVASFQRFVRCQRRQRSRKACCFKCLRVAPGFWRVPLPMTEEAIKSHELPRLPDAMSQLQQATTFQRLARCHRSQQIAQRFYFQGVTGCSSNSCFPLSNQRCN